MARNLNGIIGFKGHLNLQFWNVTFCYLRNFSYFLLRSMTKRQPILCPFYRQREQDTDSPKQIFVKHIPCEALPLNAPCTKVNKIDSTLQVFTLQWAVSGQKNKHTVPEKRGGLAGVGRCGERKPCRYRKPPRRCCCWLQPFRGNPEKDSPGFTRLSTRPHGTELTAEA